jgi:hypothetical protein
VNFRPLRSFPDSVNQLKQAWRISGPQTMTFRFRKLDPQRAQDDSACADRDDQKLDDREVDHSGGTERSGIDANGKQQKNGHDGPDKNEIPERRERSNPESVKRGVLPRRYLKTLYETYKLFLFHT